VAKDEGIATLFVMHRA